MQPDLDGIRLWHMLNDERDEPVYCGEVREHRVLRQPLRPDQPRSWSPPPWEPTATERRDGPTIDRMIRDAEADR